MDIKILGNRIIRHSGICIVKLNNRVFKIPLTFSGCKESRLEKKKLEKAKRDRHFSQYILDYKYFMGVQCTPYLPCFWESSKKRVLGERYFNSAFQAASQWGLVLLKNLVPVDYLLNFASQYVPEAYNWCNNCLTNLKVPCSSAHGDFTPDNILVKNDKLFFIDWLRYNPCSSRYFDLINFHIFFKRKQGLSWIDIWLSVYKSAGHKLWGINFSKDILLAFAIWRTAEQLKMLYERKTLDNHKVKKYTNFLKVLNKLIYEKSKN